MDVPSLLLNLGGKANQGMPKKQFNQLRARFQPKQDPKQKGKPRAIRLGALNNLVVTPQVDIRASTKESTKPVYVDGIRQQDILKNEFGAGGKVGLAFRTPSGHQFGGAAKGQYTKGKIDFPDVLRQFGAPDEQKFGTSGVDWNKITGYYRHPEGYYAEGGYNPATDDWSVKIGLKKRF
jgi:hypothetical protein